MISGIVFALRLLRPSNRAAVASYLRYEESIALVRAVTGWTVERAVAEIAREQSKGHGLTAAAETVYARAARGDLQ